MSMSVQERVNQALLTELLLRCERIGEGHCLRVDDVPLLTAAALVTGLRAHRPDVDAYVLREEHTDELSIDPDRAVGIRNSKQQALVLIVPSGEANTASSLDNSFERVPLAELQRQVAQAMERDLRSTELAGIIRTLHATGRTQGRLTGWLEFLAAVSEDRSAEHFGSELWRIALVPDCGADAETRLAQNLKASAAISQPKRPASTVAERLTQAGLSEWAPRLQIESYLDRQGLLHDVRTWAKRLLDEHPGTLTFECWPLAEQAATELKSLTMTQFMDKDGKLDSKCKLSLGEDGQLVCKVPEGGAGRVAIRWATVPAKVDSIARWFVEVLPPIDLRASDSQPAASLRVKGSARTATVPIEIDEEDVAEGNRFVVRLTAETGDGQAVQFETGQVAECESQEFQVEFEVMPPPGQERKVSSRSLAEASLRAALDGADELTEAGGTWDLEGRVFALQLGNRRAARIPVEGIIAQMQRRSLARRGSAIRYTGVSVAGEQLGFEQLSAEELELPRALADRRNAVFELIAGSVPRDTAETVPWTPELLEATQNYVATYKRALEGAASAQRAALLSMDSLTVTVSLPGNEVEAVVLLPLHPLRLAWMSKHDQLLRSWASAVCDAKPSERRRLVDIDTVARISPSNFPYFVLNAHGKPLSYQSELTHGSAIYVSPSTTDAGADVDAVCAALAIGRALAETSISAEQVSERIWSYRKAHPSASALRLLATNANDGDLLAGSLAAHVRGSVDSVDPLRFEVTAYGDRVSYARPLPRVQELQEQLRVDQRSNVLSHLMPPLGLAVRPSESLLMDDAPAHIALMQGSSRAALAGSVTPPERSPGMDGLLVPTVSEMRTIEGVPVVLSLPALRAKPGDDLTQVHRVHQLEIGRHVLDGDVFPAVQVELGHDMTAVLATLHERSDWVMAIDRHLGVAAFESLLDFDNPEVQILDYVPDFIDGIGDRLTVTTTHPQEVEAILGAAMQELGIACVGRDQSKVLRYLTAVSGRLALRLIGDNSFARESVGLAALLAHLVNRGELENAIVIPVDSHPEIFGRAARDDDEAARRCDLLIVRVGQRSFKLECVEVKNRALPKLPTALADDIVDQLQATERLLHARYFATDPARVDSPVQWARLASLLHYYADRAFSNGFIGPDRIADIHRYIDRVEDGCEQPEIGLRGFVISLDGDAGMPRRHREVPIALLTANDLGVLGFTTMFEYQQRGVAGPTALPEPLFDDEGSSTTLGSSEPNQPEAPTSIEPVSRSADVSADEVRASVSEQPAGPSTPEQPVEPSNPEISEAAVPARPDPAKLPANHSIEVVLGLDGNGGEVSWEVSTKGSPHAFVLGIPGQGKSVTTRRVIREFSSRGLPSLVFDFHGDMAANPPEGSTVLDASLGLPFSPFELKPDGATPAANAAWEVAEILQGVCGLGDIQRNNVFKALSDAYAACGWVGRELGERLPSLAEFVAHLDAIEARSRGANARARLTPLTDFGLFSDQPDEAFLERLSEGMVIDLSGIALEQVQIAAASFILRQVYTAMFSWPQGAGMRLAIVLDEAHRMKTNATIPRLMKEGRKYGVAVVLASQGADDLGHQVMENAGTKIVFRMNFPASKKAASVLRGRSGQDLSEQIETLGVGQAYVSTQLHPQARKVYMSE